MLTADQKRILREILVDVIESAVSINGDLSLKEQKANLDWIDEIQTIRYVLEVGGWIDPVVKGD